MQVSWNKGIKLRKIYPIPTLCACGCNEIVWGNHKFIKNHDKRGKRISKEHGTKISIANKGRSVWNKGKTGLQNKNKTSFKKGNTPWNQWKKNCFSDATLKKLSNSHTGISVNVGDKNGSWKGGISFVPYCDKFNNELKERIRNRDNRTCRLCGCNENGTKHSVHHIHYDKENCHPDLITLCRRCNTKVNFNRDYYEDMFMQQLNNRGLLPLES